MGRRGTPDRAIPHDKRTKAIGGKRPTNYTRLTNPDLIELTVVVDPTVDLDELAGYAETLFGMCMTIHGQMQSKQSVDLSEPIGMWAETANNIANLEAQLRERTLNPLRLGKLHEETAWDLRRKKALLLSQVLSQVRLVRAYAEETGPDGELLHDILDEKGKVAFWAAVSQRKLAVSAAKILEELAKVVMYIDKKFAVAEQSAGVLYGEVVHGDNHQ